MRIERLVGHTLLGLALVAGGCSGDPEPGETVGSVDDTIGDVDVEPEAPEEANPMMPKRLAGSYATRCQGACRVQLYKCTDDCDRNERKAGSSAELQAFSAGVVQCTDTCDSALTTCKKGCEDLDSESTYRCERVCAVTHFECHGDCNGPKPIELGCEDKCGLTYGECLDECDDGPECWTHSDCGLTNVCFNRECQPGCRSSADCPADHICVDLGQDRGWCAAV